MMFNWLYYLNPKKIIQPHALLALIFLFGFLLRLFGLLTFPLSHDELSVLYRSQFSDIQDWWNYGVMIDTHPPLAHVITFFWIKFFGISTISIKFPFFIIGLLSIPLSYIVGRDYLNHFSGLFLAASMATLQFPLTYSLYARPYVLGLCIILALFYCWNRVFDNSKSYKYWFGIVFFTVLACYNHYFSMLTAAVLLLLGIPRAVSHKILKQYVSSMIIVGILFIPYVPFFFKQLSQKGLDWLGPPRLDFFWEYLKYIFHFSYLYILFLFVMIFYMFKNGISNSTLKKSVFLFFIFFLPFLIGFLYSLYVKPVLQYSMLLFSWPFLILWFACFFPKLTSKATTLIILFFLGLNILTLYQRDYLITAQKHPFNSFAHIFSVEKAKKSDLIAFTSMNKNYSMYYLDTLYEADILNLFFNQTPELTNWRDYLTKLPNRNILLCNIPRQYISVAREIFPNTFVYDEGFNYSLIGLTKDHAGKTKSGDSILFEKKLNTLFSISNDSGFVFLRSTEYGLSHNLQLDTLISNRHAVVEVAVRYSTDTSCAGVMVLEIANNTKSVSWDGVEMMQFYDSNRVIQSSYLYRPLHLLFKNNNEFQGHQLKIYLWNREHCFFEVKDYSIKILTDNKYEYGLFEDIY